MSRTDFGSHEYWRAQGLFNGFTALSAMLFRDETGSSIASTGGTALESGHFSTFSSAALFDGTDATFWESSNIFNAWAGYRFATAKKVMQIALQKTASMDGSLPPFAAIFQYSDDGETWVDVAWVQVAANLVNDVPTWYDLAGAL